MIFASRGRQLGLVMGAVAFATVAFFACGSGGSNDPNNPNNPNDAYANAANRFCLAARQEAAQARRHHRAAFHRGDPIPLAHSLFTVVGHLHIHLQQLRPAEEEAGEAFELAEAEFELEKPILSLINAFNPDRQRVLVEDGRLASIGSRIETRARAMGLDQCARLDPGAWLRAG
jgi:hypothetical protein